MSLNEPAANEESFRLREYLNVLRVRKWSVIVITLLAILGALFYIQRQSPTYTSTARVLATNPTAAFAPANSLAPVNMVNEVALVSSSRVQKCAFQIYNQSIGEPVVLPSPSPSASPSPRPSASASASAAPAPAPTASTPPSPPTLGQLCSDPILAGVSVLGTGFSQGLGVSNAPGTTFMSISYSSHDRARSQAAAQAFAQAYVEIKTLDGMAFTANQRAPLFTERTSVTAKAANALTQFNAANNRGDTTSASFWQTQYNNFISQQNAVNANIASFCDCKLTNPEIVTDAPLPTAPSAPKKPLILAGGLFLGLALGIGIAFLRERLDDTLRGRADLEDQLGVPVLAVVPRVPGWKKKGDVKLISIEQPKASVAEAYRTLRTSVLFAAAQRGLKTIMVTSPTAGEGKTTTAANLAVVLADAGKRVILVSADLRKPRIHKFFDLPNDRGLSSALAGDVKPWEALTDPGREHLRVMPSGPVPAHPAELLQSEQMGELIEELREVADFVILDTAPVLLVADALALAPLVDGILFVVDAESTHRGAVAQSREQLEQVGAPLIGSIFNNFDPAKARGYSSYGYYGAYRYRYGYGGYHGGGYYAEPVREGGERRRRARALPPDQSE